MVELLATLILALILVTWGTEAYRAHLDEARHLTARRDLLFLRRQILIHVTDGGSDSPEVLLEIDGLDPSSLEDPWETPYVFEPGDRLRGIPGLLISGGPDRRIDPDPGSDDLVLEVRLPPPGRHRTESEGPPDPLENLVPGVTWSLEWGHPPGGSTLPHLSPPHTDPGARCAGCLPRGSAGVEVALVARVTGSLERDGAERVESLTTSARVLAVVEPGVPPLLLDPVARPGCSACERVHRQGIESVALGWYRLDLDPCPGPYQISMVARDPRSEGVLASGTLRFNLGGMEDLAVVNTSPGEGGVMEGQHVEVTLATSRARALHSTWIEAGPVGAGNFRDLSPRLSVDDVNVPSPGQLAVEGPDRLRVVFSVTLEPGIRQLEFRMSYRDLERRPEYRTTCRRWKVFMR